MSDARIAPALTQWQWAQKYLTVQALEYDSANNAAAEIHAGPDCLYVTEHEHPRYAVIDTAQQRHALAALALYGQPFGFTQEELDLLVWMRDSYEEPVLNVMQGEVFDAIVAKIAALLPPDAHA